MTRRICGIAGSALVVVACAAAIWAAFVRTDGTAVARDRPDDQSAEAGFARDMAVHHSQAVEMADLIRARTSDPKLTLLATDIALGQQVQIGRFYGWLEQWDLPATAARPMAWMGEGHDTTAMTMTMPGMATTDEIRRLRDLPLADAEIAFLQLMIRHHRGGVEMAAAALERTTRTEVRRVAESIVAAQTSEIDAMTTLLAARGATLE